MDNPSSPPGYGHRYANGESVLQKHGIALGYFALSVFCILTSAHCFEVFSPLLIVAASLAMVAGIGYIAEPFVVKLRAARAWIVEMIRLAQETPSHPSVKPDENH
jgi:hypothetical protein